MKIKKIALFTLIGLFGFGLLLGAFAIIGLKETKQLNIQSVDISSLEDGEYSGEYLNYRWSNEVKVTIENHEITQIVSIRKTETDAQYNVIEDIISTIIVEQDIDIDTVAGATATTKSFLKAVEDALVE